MNNAKRFRLPEHIQENLKMNIKSTLLALSLCISSTAFADGIAAVKNFNENIKSFAGDFSQTIKNAKKTTTSQGTFAVLRPGFFKWTYHKPDEQLIVGDGNSVWLYDKELAQVTQRKQQAVLGSSPAAILSDKAALDSNFTLKNDGEKDGLSFVIATPKTPDSEYKQIRLGFSDNNTLKEMQLQDSFGNQTHIVFSNVKNNPDLPKKDFQFTPPDGVDVVREDE